MGVPVEPNSIARETLRQLVSRKLAPTPDNYRDIYFDVAGIPDPAEPCAAEIMLHRLVSEFPRVTPDLARLGKEFTGALGARNWDRLRELLIECARPQPVHNAPPPDWVSLLFEMARLIHAPHAALSITNKHLAIQKTLSAGGNMESLFVRLQALAEKWENLPLVENQNEPADRIFHRAPFLPDSGNTPPHTVLELSELLARTLQASIAARLVEEPDLVTEAAAIVESLRASAIISGLPALRARLNSLCMKLESHGNERNRVENGLLGLLRLLIDNIGELVADDAWVRGQIAVVDHAISRPLNAVSIEDAQRRLKDVIFKQGLLKQGLSEARSTLKEMVVSFIDQMGHLSDSTGNYHDRIENLAQRIRETDDMEGLNRLLEEVMHETRTVQKNTLHARETVLAARQKVVAAESRIRQLKTELEQVSEKVREDDLTGMLNRRGLSEALARELDVSRRYQRPLSIALLDIDNFKSLNDSIGHQAGDDALIHLSTVIRSTMRPSDVVARFGGEEFLILLPGSDCDEAVNVIARLQRELTKQLFLHNNQKLLITFSAGVANHSGGESEANLIYRADRALYQAKRTGKNRVVAAAHMPPAVTDESHAAAPDGYPEPRDPVSLRLVPANSNAS